MEELEVTQNFNGSVEPVAENAIPIVTGFDNNFAIGAAALLNTILRTASEKNVYDIVILEDNVSKNNKERLVDIVKGRENFSIRFFDINAIPKIKTGYSHAHFSLAMYGRLFIPILFSKYKKIIYIDSDTVVCSDLAELLSYDMKDKMVAAVRDINMEGYVHHKIKSAPGCGRVEAGSYLKNTVGIQDPMKYFYSGMIVLNIPKILESGKERELVYEIGGKFWLPDQDILNKVLNGNVYYLDLSWNLLHGNGDMKTFTKLLLDKTRDEYFKAREKPKVIHYAGDQKPWLNKNVDFFDEFYNSIAGTTWEEDLNRNLEKSNIKSILKRSNWPYIIKRFRYKLSPILNIILPHGSQIRVLVSKIYTFIFYLLVPKK